MWECVRGEGDNVKKDEITCESCMPECLLSGPSWLHIDIYVCVFVLAVHLHVWLFLFITAYTHVCSNALISTLGRSWHNIQPQQWCVTRWCATIHSCQKGHNPWPWMHCCICLCVPVSTCASVSTQSGWRLLNPLSTAGRLLSFISALMTYKGTVTF